MSFEEYLDFDKFIAKDVIKFVYFFGLIFLTLGALIIAIWGRMDPFNIKTTQEAWATALIFLIPGNLIWRLLCEYIVILFRINESLISIDRKTREG